MAKRIALVLIMVLLFNSTAWASGVEQEAPFPLWGLLLVIGGALLLGVFVTVAVVAEADAPDDGIRLVSTSDKEAVPRESSFMNILQNVSFGYSPQDDRTFVGFRFQF